MIDVKATKTGFSLPKINDKQRVNNPKPKVQVKADLRRLAREKIPKLSLSASVCCFSWRGSGRRGKVGMAVLLWTQVEIVSLHKPARYPLDKQDLSYSPHGLSLLGLGPLQIVFSSVSQHLYLKGLGNQIEFKYLDKNN